MIPDTPYRPRSLVVVADDGVEAGAMLRMTLKFLGHDVAIAVNGPRLPTAFALHRPDAVLTDMYVPLLDALELCRCIRLLPGGVSVPFVLWSNQDTDDPQVRAALGLPGVEFLSVSLSFEEMGVAVGLILEPQTIMIA